MLLFFIFYLSKNKYPYPWSLTVTVHILLKYPTYTLIRFFIVLIIFLIIRLSKRMKTNFNTRGWFEKVLIVINIIINIIAFFPIIFDVIGLGSI
jgi:hypothetical protein